MPARLSPAPTTTPPPVPVVPAHWTFPAEPASVPRARHAITQTLPTHCHPQLRDNLRLLTSELVTNAVRHGPQPAHDHQIDLILWPTEQHYWIAVSDAGATLPTLNPHAHPDADSGRGLHLIDALSAAWTITPRHTRGKTVIAGIRLDGD